MRFFALFSEERQKKLHEMKARNWQKIIILKRRSFFTVYVQNIMLIPNFHFLPFCLRATTQNTSFFHMNKHGTTGARLTNLSRREIESGNHDQRPLFWCVTPIFLSAIRNFYLSRIMSRPYLIKDVIQTDNYIKLLPWKQ